MWEVLLAPRSHRLLRESPSVWWPKDPKHHRYGPSELDEKPVLLEEMPHTLGLGHRAQGRLEWSWESPPQWLALVSVRQLFWLL